MRMRTVYASLVCALALQGQAYAARNEEIVRSPTLLMFGEVGQSIGTIYTFAQNSGSTTTSRSASSLSEKYSISTVAAILNPHLINFQILAGVSYSQQFDTKTSTLLDGQYSIGAIMFDMTYHPISLGTSRSTTLISDGFTPSYSLTSTSNQIGAALLNARVPVEVYYVHTTSQSDGLAQNTSTTSDAAGLALHHDYQDISNTNFSVSTSGTQSGIVASNTYAASLGNYLALDKAHRYRLSSSLDITDSKTGSVPQRNVNIAEELFCAFGSALTGTLADRFAYNSTLNFQNQTQTIQSNSITASLTHRLYASLSTSLSGSYSHGSVLGGTTSTYGGTMRVGYTKQLPAQSVMTLTVDGSRTISSQDLQQSILTARDEAHRQVKWGDSIVPDLSGTLVPGSIIVTSLNAVLTTVYLEGTDYRVDFQTGRIEILTGGNIPQSGSDIAITYQVQVNPSISFETNSVGGSASVLLLGGRYILTGTLSTQGEKSLSSKSSSNQGLVSSTNLNLHADANFNPALFGVEYGSVTSSQEKSSHFAGYASYLTRTANDASVSYTMRDTYSMVDRSGAGSSASNQNSLSLGASYSRRIFGLAKWDVGVNLSDSRGGSRYSDFVSLRTALAGAFNQLQFSLIGQTHYRITGTATAQDSSLTCSVTRTF